MIVKTLFSYRGRDFPEFSVAGLLASVKVSAVRPVPCTVRGRIIGKGVPGLIWSEDFVLRDETGIIFLDYRQPLRLWEVLFGLLQGDRHIGREVMVEGWYRRSPMPHLEIKSIKTGSETKYCYVYHVKIVLGVCLMLGGIIASLMYMAV